MLTLGATPIPAFVSAWDPLQWDVGTWLACISLIVVGGFAALTLASSKKTERLLSELRQIQRVERDLVKEQRDNLFMLRSMQEFEALHRQRASLVGLIGPLRVLGEKAELLQIVMLAGRAAPELDEATSEGLAATLHDPFYAQVLPLATVHEIYDLLGEYRELQRLWNGMYSDDSNDEQFYRKLQDRIVVFKENVGRIFAEVLNSIDHIGLGIQKRVTWLESTGGPRDKGEVP